jgi:hypothetical protein
MENVLPIAGFILLGIGAFLALGFLIKVLWNWLLPNISNIKKVTYLQALGILILAKLLFGSFCPPHHGWAGHQRHCNDNSGYCGKWDGCKSQDESGKEEKLPDVK